MEEFFRQRLAHLRSQKIAGIAGIAKEFKR